MSNDQSLTNYQLFTTGTLTDPNMVWQADGMYDPPSARCSHSLANVEVTSIGVLRVSCVVCDEEMLLAGIPLAKIRQQFVALVRQIVSIDDSDSINRILAELILAGREVDELKEELDSLCEIANECSSRLDSKLWPTPGLIDSDGSDTQSQRAPEIHADGTALHSCRDSEI